MRRNISEHCSYKRHWLCIDFIFAENYFSIHFSMCLLQSTTLRVFDQPAQVVLSTLQHQQVLHRNLFAMTEQPRILQPVPCSLFAPLSDTMHVHHALQKNNDQLPTCSHFLWELSFHKVHHTRRCREYIPSTFHLHRLHLCDDLRLVHHKVKLLNEEFHLQDILLLSGDVHHIPVAF